MESAPTPTETERPKRIRYQIDLDPKGQKILEEVIRMANLAKSVDAFRNALKLYHHILESQNNGEVVEGNVKIGLIREGVLEAVEILL